MPHERTVSPAARDATERLCQRCGERAHPVTRIAATVQNPAFRIWRCHGCAHVEWIEERSTNSLDPYAPPQKS